jgi:hypothetical protein
LKVSETVTVANNVAVLNKRKHFEAVSIQASVKKGKIKGSGGKTMMVASIKSFFS